MTKKSDAPAIRFKGFSDAWEQRKFSELVQIERGGSPRPIDDFITDAPNGLNWVKIGDAPTQGNYITKTAEKIRPEGLSKTREVHPGDLILSNSMSFGKPYIMGIDGCIHDGWLLIRNTYGVFDLTFLCHLLGTPQMLSQYRSLAAGSTVNNLNKELVENTVVTIPSITEQRVLGDYLEQLDNLITLHQRKFEKLTNVKKSMLEKMFPQNGSSYPEIRFKGFTDPWEQRKLGELVDRVVRKNTNNESTLPLTISAQYGLVDQITYFNNRVASRDVSNYYLVLNGEFAYNKSTSDGYPFGAVKRLDLYEKGVLSTLYIVFAPKKEQLIDSDYLTVFFDTDRWHKGVAERAAEGARNHGLLNISAEDFFDIDLSVPKDIVEQKQIGAFIRQLDSLITLHQRKCVFLFGFFQAFISMIFTASTFSWEQRKLGDVVKEITRNEPESEAPIMMITANNGFIEQSERYAFNNAGESLKKYILLKKGELAYNHGASKLRPYGSCFALTTAENARIPFVYHCFSAENQNAEFMSIELNGAEIENQLRKIVSSGARMDGLLNISFDEYTSVSVLLPGTEEQDRIADFFRHLDNLITLHQRECISFTARAGRLILTANKKRNTSSWEQRKLSEITDKVTEKNAGLQYVETFTNSAEFGIISQRDFFDHDIAKLGSLDGYYIVKNEDFVYNPRISTSAPVGPINRNKLGRTGVMSPLYTVFRPHDIDTTYLEYFFKCGYWHSFMNFNGDSGARSDRFSIRDNVFFQMPIPIPDIDEQRKIGELLTCLDNLITLHQRKPFLMKWRTSDANRNQTNRLVL